MNGILRSAAAFVTAFVFAAVSSSVILASGGVQPGVGLGGVYVPPAAGGGAVESAGYVIAFGGQQADGDYMNLNDNNDTPSATSLPQNEAILPKAGTITRIAFKGFAVSTGRGYELMLDGVSTEDLDADTGEITILTVDHDVSLGEKVQLRGISDFGTDFPTLDFAALMVDDDAAEADTGYTYTWAASNVGTNDPRLWELGSTASSNEGTQEMSIVSDGVVRWFVWRVENAHDSDDTFDIMVNNVSADTIDVASSTQGVAAAEADVDSTDLIELDSGSSTTGNGSHFHLVIEGD